MNKNTEKATATVEPKKKINMAQQRDRKKVRGMFKFYEVPGGVLNFVYNNYKEDPVEKFSLVDGEVYEIPLGVAKHLNKNGWYPVHQYKDTDTGVKMRIGQKVHRFGFQSLDFTDMDELAPEKELVTVEHVA